MENKNLYDYGSVAFSFNDYFSERKRKTKSKVEITISLAYIDASSRIMAENRSPEEEDFSFTSHLVIFH